MDFKRIKFTETFNDDGTLYLRGNLYFVETSAVAKFVNAGVAELYVDEAEEPAIAEHEHEEA